MFPEGICAGSLRDILLGGLRDKQRVCGHVPIPEGLGAVGGARGARRSGLLASSSLYPTPAPLLRSAAVRTAPGAGFGVLGAGVRGRCPQVSLLLSGRKGLSIKPPSFRRPPRKGRAEFRVQGNRCSQTYHSPPNQRASGPWPGGERPHAHEPAFLRGGRHP